MTAAARVTTLGEALGVIRGAGTGSLAGSDAATVGTGGSEGNVAIGLARSGIPCSWLGRVGDDALGRRVVRDLRGEGVDVRAIVDPAAPTGLLLKDSPIPGRTVVHSYRSGSAGSRLSAADVPFLEIGDSTLLHLTGVAAAISATAAAAVETAIAEAEIAGVPVSFDVNHRAALWTADVAAPILRSIASRSALLFAGLEEARLLLDDDRINARHAAAALADLGPREVVVKLGEGGAIAWESGRTAERRAWPITPVDTVGAGDAFVAGYLAVRLTGGQLDERLERGTRCGALACLHPGDWEGFPRPGDLALLDDTDPVRR